MNTLVVYDSQYGNTERLARAIADTALAAGQMRLVHVDPAQLIEIGETDLLIVGCPTQGWRPTPAILSFLETLSSDDVRGLTVACFDTRFPKPRWLTGSAARSMAKMFRALGIAPVVPPESFFVGGREGPLVSGELDRAVTWARTVLAKMDVPEPIAR
jgi:flavodoxin